MIPKPPTNQVLERVPVLQIQSGVYGRWRGDIEPNLEGFNKANRPSISGTPLKYLANGARYVHSSRGIAALNCTGYTLPLPARPQTNQAHRVPLKTKSVDRDYTYCSSPGEASLHFTKTAKTTPPRSNERSMLEVPLLRVGTVLRLE